MADIKIVATADLHIDHGHYGRVIPSLGRHSAWESAYNCWMAVCRMAVEEKADAFLALGDLFVNGHPSPEAQEMVAEGIRFVAGEGIPVIAFRGNHELIGIRSDHRTAIDRYDDIEGVTVASKAEVVVLPSGLQVATLPWPRVARLRSELDLGHMSAEDADDMIAGHLTGILYDLAGEVDLGRGPAVLAAHATVGEATVGSDRRGSEMTIANIFHEPVLPAEIVEDGPWGHVSLGHIHKRQKVGEKSWYVGSPDRIDFSDEHLEKGASLVTFSDADGSATVELIPTPARVLRTVHVHSEGAVEDVAAVFNEVGENEIVKVVLDEPNKVVEAEARRLVSAHGATLARIEAKPKVDPARREAVSVEPDVPVLEGLSKYLDKREVEDDRKNELIEAAKTLMEEK